MLTAFTVSRTFCNRSAVRVTLYVEPAARLASGTVTRDRRIIAMQDVHAYEVDTPEKAESWIGRTVADPREAGAVISWLEHLALQPA